MRANIDHYKSSREWIYNSLSQIKYSDTISYQNNGTDKDNSFMESSKTHSLTKCHEMTEPHHVPNNDAIVYHGCSGDTHKEISISNQVEKKSVEFNNLDFDWTDEMEKISENIIKTDQKHIVEYRKNPYDTISICMSDEDFENSSVCLNKVFLKHNDKMKGFSESKVETGHCDEIDEGCVRNLQCDNIIQKAKCRMKSDFAKRLKLCKKFGEILSNETGLCMCAFFERDGNKSLNVNGQIFLNWFDNTRKSILVKIRNMQYMDNFRVLNLCKINLNQLSEYLAKNKLNHGSIEQGSVSSLSIQTNATKSSAEYGCCFSDIEENIDNMDDNILPYEQCCESIHDADLCQDFSTFVEDENCCDEQFSLLHLCEDCHTKYMKLDGIKHEKCHKYFKELDSSSELFLKMEQLYKEIFLNNNHLETNDSLLDLVENSSEKSYKKIFHFSNKEFEIITNNKILQNIQSALNSSDFIDKIVNLIQSEEDFSVVIVEAENSPKFYCETGTSEDRFDKNCGLNLHRHSNSKTSLSSLKQHHGEDVISLLRQIRNIDKNIQGIDMEDEKSKISGIDKTSSKDTQSTVSKKSSMKRESHGNDSLHSNISQHERSESGSIQKSGHHSIIITISSRSIIEKDSDSASVKTKSSSVHTKSVISDNPSRQMSRGQSKISRSEEVSQNKSSLEETSKQTSILEEESYHAPPVHDISKTGFSEDVSHKESLSKLSISHVQSKISRLEETCQEGSLSKVSSQKNSLPEETSKQTSFVDEESYRATPVHDISKSGFSEDVSHKESLSKLSTSQVQSQISRLEEICHERSLSKVASQKKSLLEETSKHTSFQETSVNNISRDGFSEDVSHKESLSKVSQKSQKSSRSDKTLEHTSLPNDDSQHRVSEDESLQDEISHKRTCSQMSASGTQSKLSTSEKASYPKAAKQNSLILEEISKLPSLYGRSLVEKDKNEESIYYHLRNCFICHIEYVPIVVYLCNQCFVKMKVDYGIVSRDEIDNEPEKSTSDNSSLPQSQTLEDIEEVKSNPLTDNTEKSESTMENSIQSIEKSESNSLPKSEKSESVKSLERELEPSYTSISEKSSKSQNQNTETVPPRIEDQVNNFCPCSDIEMPTIVLECEESDSIEECICSETDIQPNVEQNSENIETSKSTSKYSVESQKNINGPEKSISKVSSKASSASAREESPEKSISKVSTKVSSDIVGEEVHESSSIRETSESIISSKLSAKTSEGLHKESTEKSISNISSKASSAFAEEESPEKSISKVSTKVSSDIVEEEVHESSSIGEASESIVSSKLSMKTSEGIHEESTEKSISKVSSKASSAFAKEESPEESISKVSTKVSSDIVEEEVHENSSIKETSESIISSKLSAKTSEGLHKESTEKSISNISSKASSAFAEEESPEKSISKVSTKVSSDIVEEEVHENSSVEETSEKISQVSSKLSTKTSEGIQESPEKSTSKVSSEASSALIEEKSPEKSISKVCSKVSSEDISQIKSKPSLKDSEEIQEISEKSVSKISSKISSDIVEQVQENLPTEEVLKEACPQCDGYVGASNCTICDACLQIKTKPKEPNVPKTHSHASSTISSQSQCIHTNIVIDIININQALCSKKHPPTKSYKHRGYSQHSQHISYDHSELGSITSTDSTKSLDRHDKTENCRKLSQESCDYCGKLHSSHCFIIEKRKNEIRIKIPTFRCAECIAKKGQPGIEKRSVGFEDPLEKMHQTYAIQLCASCENTFILERGDRSNANCELLPESADDVKEVFERINKIVPECGCSPGCHHESHKGQEPLMSSHNESEKEESYDGASMSSKCDGTTQGLLIAQYITDTSIIFKWDVPEIEGISGYELHINGLVMHKIKCPSRSCVILQDIPLTSNVIHVKCIMDSE